jgi:hypothetical protein
MDREELVESIRERIAEIRRDMQYDYTYTTSHSVEVTVEGHTQHFDVENDIELTLEAVADDTIEDALKQIESDLSDLMALPSATPIHEMDSGEIMEALSQRIQKERDEKIVGSSAWSGLASCYVDSLQALLYVKSMARVPHTTPSSTPAATPAAPVVDEREKWSRMPGDSYDASDFPRLYQPPDGYDWTGEWRQPESGEPFVSSSGVVSNGGNPRRGIVRQILRKLAPGEAPTYQPPSRAPWPGSGVMSNYAYKEFAEQYDPPTGFAYQGEYRHWRSGEPFLNSHGRVELAKANGGMEERHILIPLPGIPLPGSEGAGETGPLEVPPASASAPAPTPAPPAPATFEPPTVPEPV